MTSSVAGLRKSSRALSRVTFAPKIGQVTGGQLALSHNSFQNPSETITSKK